MLVLALANHRYRQVARDSSMTISTIGRRVAKLERMDEEKNMAHTEKSRGYMVYAQTQQEREKDPLYHEKTALLELSNTAPSKWTCCIKDRMSEVIRQVFKTPGYTGAMLIMGVADAFNDVPEIQDWLIRGFTERGVMPGIEEEHDRIERTED